MKLIPTDNGIVVLSLNDDEICVRLFEVDTPICDGGEIEGASETDGTEWVKKQSVNFGLTEAQFDLALEELQNERDGKGI